MRLMMCRCALVALPGLALLGSFASAHADPGGQFASASVSCASNGVGHYTTGPVSPGRDGYVVRLAAVGSGGALFQDDAFNFERRLVGSDTVWASGGSFGAGASLDGLLHCDSGSSFSGAVTFFDVPTAPVSYSGATTFGSWESVVDFRAPGEAQYVAELTLTQGAVQLSGGAFQQSFASSGTYQLGTVARGVGGLRVDALEGPQAHWTVAIRPLSVALGGLSFGRGFARPGDILTLEYTTSGDTNVTASIAGPGGNTVRNLATNLPVGSGSHTLTWDGFDAAGAPLADGTYMLRMQSLDPSGLGNSGQTQVTLDGTGPSIAVASPSKLPAGNAFVADVDDSLSGVEYATLQIDGRQVAQLGTAPSPYSIARAAQGSSAGRLAYRPTRGWRRGTSHRWRIQAHDKTGNERIANGTFRIPAAPKKPKVRKCRSVVIFPRTDYVLDRVRARGIGCKAARRKLRAWAKGRYGPRRIPPAFRCSVRKVGLVERQWTCRAGKGHRQKVMTFRTGP
jgi:hypothetical protein